jgi:hypothetical protein
MSIQQRALLISFSASSWSARKYDRKISEKVAAEHGASSDAGRYNKMLLPGDAISYKELTSHLSAMRTEHYKQTLAWDDNGLRLLPIANRAEYRQKFVDGAAELSRLRENFLADYPSMKESARASLNGMFKEEDYPSVDTLRGKFAVSMDEFPIPESGDFRVNLSAEEIAELEARNQERVNTLTGYAMRDAWDRLHTCVEHFHARLAQPGAIFRDSLVENVREVCDVLQRLNVANDPALEELRNETAGRLAVFDAQDLRDSDATRAYAVDASADILSSIRRTRRIETLETVNQ